MKRKSHTQHLAYTHDKVDEWSLSDIRSSRTSIDTYESIDMQHQDSYRIDNDTVFTENEETDRHKEPPRLPTPYKALFRNNLPIHKFSFPPYKDQGDIQVRTRSGRAVRPPERLDM